MNIEQLKGTRNHLEWLEEQIQKTLTPNEIAKLGALYIGKSIQFQADVQLFIAGQAYKA